jgi:hypothetical protein
MRNKFKLSKGDISRYALACGYTQQREISPGVQVTLWHEGGPCYHVRAHDFNNGVRLFWYTSESLTAARRAYRKGAPV